jgi:hypothetical protein
MERTNSNGKNPENQVLTDAQLDNVAGGFIFTIGGKTYQSSLQETTDRYIHRHTK